MTLNFAKECEGLKHIATSFIEGNPALAAATAVIDFEVGSAKNPAFQVPATAQDAVYVGDAARISGYDKTAEVEALFKRDPNLVSMRPVYNADTQSWKYAFSKAVAAVDAAYSQLGGQAISPWNVSFFQRIFKEPLLYSNARKLVRVEQGTNPWASYMTLMLQQYAGFATATSSGSTQNQMTSDVNVIDGMMTAGIINLTATYTYTMEEQKRNAQTGMGNPFAGEAMSSKPLYANYVLDLLTDYITYYGNKETATLGLFGVNPINVWDGPSLKEINDGSSVAKGNLAYELMYKILNEFCTKADNKFDKVRVAMSPEAYNYFCTLPYSSQFDPTSARKIFIDNYASGIGKDGKALDVEFISDPMLKAKSIFNESAADRMIITAPSVGAGPKDQEQPLILLGMPLEKYVFPVIPGVYNTQFKTLRRIAGIFPPVPGAIAAFQGFGRKV